MELESEKMAKSFRKPKKLKNLRPVAQTLPKPLRKQKENKKNKVPHTDWPGCGPEYADISLELVFLFLLVLDGLVGCNNGRLCFLFFQGF